MSPVCMSSSLLNTLLPSIVHSRHKLQEPQSTELLEHHKSDVTISIQYVSIGARNLYLISVVGPSYFANFPYHICHLELRLLLED